MIFANNDSHPHGGMMKKIGILHPGQMGISVAVSIRNSGHEVYWASERRSQQTRERAESHDLLDIGTLSALCQACEMIVSVCPPHAAEDVANSVIAQGFRGIFVEANAIAPEKTIRIGRVVTEAGIAYVDGGIIGGPAWKAGTTRLYLSGESAREVAAAISGGALGVCVNGDEIGDASALKMVYAAYTKGTTALLCGIMAVAEALGVREDLEGEWVKWEGDFAEQTRNRVRRVTAKAWRFEGEMEEIASTFGAAGLPEGFHQAAATIYHRMAGFKDAQSLPLLEDVLTVLKDEK
jgi:3-hydroxyisobutyrate dehydrogenase-like beta-hydroxyacid dehydrogenase